MKCENFIYVINNIGNVIIIIHAEDIVNIIFQHLETYNAKIYYLAQLSKELRDLLLTLKYPSERIMISSLNNRMFHIGIDMKQAKSIIISLQNNNLVNTLLTNKNSVSIDDIKRETISIPVNDIILYYSKLRKILMYVLAVKNHCLYIINSISSNTLIVNICNMFPSVENNLYRTIKNGYDITDNFIFVRIKREEYMVSTSKDLE